MGKKTKKPGKGKEKTEKKTAKAEQKKARRETKKLSPEDDIDAILLSIQKEEAKKKEVHIEENVPAPSPRSNCSFGKAMLSTEYIMPIFPFLEFLCMVGNRKTNSLDDLPGIESELILYGGEFYNGNKTFVYGDLYRYDVEKQDWKLISSPNSPPPRSAHQAVAWKNYLYIFGGEFTSPNQERFHHYKDFWVLDLKTNQWEQLNYKGCPSPRSGHRMLCVHFVILETIHCYMGLKFCGNGLLTYFNDLHVFDLDIFKWQEIKPKPGAMWPSARSGFQFSVYQDEVYLYGGYSKEVSSDKNSSSEKGIVHSDMWSLDPRTWDWNKGTCLQQTSSAYSSTKFAYEVKKSGMPPGSRAGFSMCVHKKRAVLFGGVVDMEMEVIWSDRQNAYETCMILSIVAALLTYNPSTTAQPLPEAYTIGDSKYWDIAGDTFDTLEEVGELQMASLSLDEPELELVLFGDEVQNVEAVNVELNEYPLELRKEKSTKDKMKKKIDEKPNGIAFDSKTSLSEVATNADNMEVDMESNIDEISSHMERNVGVDDSKLAVGSDGKPHESSSKLVSEDSVSQEIVKPCGRINACMVVGRDTLYIYGGMMEVRDQEITLDDLYALNLSKLDEWKCLIPASESEWVEVSEDEDDDDDDEDADSEDEDEEGDSESDSNETDDDDDYDDIKARNGGSTSTSLELGDAVAIIKGGVKKLRRKEKRARIEQIRASLGLSDLQRTPMPGESLKDFYKRTNMYWQMAAYEHTEHTGKELRKDGFDLADTRYKELKPILDELAILEAEQKAEEEEGPETTSRKRGSKKNKQLGAK
ncbi:hypothetical protein LguiA_009670 [Lonicera macranthoides]